MSIDIITPAFNAEATIAETIESVLQQRETDWAYWIIDDGSTDGTAAVITKYLDDSRIRLLEQENRGVADAANRALAEVRGDYVAFLGADDIWLPDYLHEMRAKLDANPGWGLLWCEMECFGSARGLYRGDRTPVAGSAQETIPGIFSDITFLGSATLCRASYFKEGLRFPTEYQVMEDIHVWAAIAEAADIGHLEKALVRYRVHENSLSNAPDCMLRNYRVNIRSFRALYRRYKRWIRHRLYRRRMWWLHHYAGDELVKLGRAGQRPTLAALYYRPFSPRSWKSLLQGASNLFGSRPRSDVRSVTACSSLPSFQADEDDTKQKGGGG